MKYNFMDIEMHSFLAKVMKTACNVPHYPFTDIVIITYN